MGKSKMITGQKPIIWIVLALFGVMMPGCIPKKEVLISGKTMGTTYHIKVISGYFTGYDRLKEDIQKRLDELNQSMSTYIQDSEISKFNALDDPDKVMVISKDFYAVMVQAERLYRLSGGALDGTLEPIIDLWGFGRSGRRADSTEIPTAREIEERLSAVGFDKIEILKNNAIRKKIPSISIDLNAIAKGYAVDQVAVLLRKNRIEDFIVEIGGEMIASGLRADNKKWRVGINVPRADADYTNVYKVIELHNKAMATSGDYRNFFEIGGNRYSHIFDPKTGYPVTNGVVSVTVIAETCVMADGLSTALMVMGSEKGLSLVNSIEGVECLIIAEEPDGELKDYYSKGFQVLQ